MFEGVHTAIVTPFTEDGELDISAFRDLIEFQIEGGVDGIVPVGTTGESPTLDYNEHKKIIETAVEAVNGRIKVIAGTGGNSTSEALDLTRHANEVGADGSLQVTPYYNKPSDAGLLAHFRAVADVGLPVILYNIPGRTSRDLSVEMVVELAKHPNITAIKEASGDLNRVSLYKRHCDIEVLSGDDPLTLPLMILGGIGVICVTSNIVPAAISELVHAGLDNDWDTARALHADYHRLMTDLFLEVNPVPIKAALAMMGKIEETYRLPLCRMGEGNRNKLKDCLKHYGLIEHE